MKITILSLIFSPDNVSTAQIWASLAEDFKAAGHEVRVITTTPHFHRDASMERKQPLRNWLWRFVRKSDYAGIPVYHVLMPDKSVWPPLRMLSWIWFHFVATLLGWIMRFKPDIVVAPSPPLTIGLNAWAIAAVRRAKYVYNVQEIYPDIAINLGMMKRPCVIKFFRAVERITYAKAAAVTSITPAMCAKIASRTDPAKVRHIPNFVDLSDIREVGHDNEFACEHGLGGKFVLTYAGNMGVPQKLGVMVELARRIPDLTVMFVGGGGDAARLKREADGLGNVIFVDYQPISRMSEIYAASDLFYVGQDPQAASDGIPSKIYRILGHNKPILAMTSPESDLAGFMRASGGGVLIGDDLDAAAATVRELMGNPSRLASLAEAGRDYVRDSFSRSTVADAYLRLFSVLL